MDIKNEPVWPMKFIKPVMVETRSPPMSIQVEKQVNTIVTRQKSATTKLTVTGSWFMARVDKKTAITITPNETPAMDLRENAVPLYLISRSLIIPNKKAARIPTENTRVV